MFKLLYILAGLIGIGLIATNARAGDIASYYGYESGGRTANGERFNPLGRTCAHRTHPFGMLLRVTYQGRSAICRVNDRGPYKPPRTIDLSLGVARSLGLIAAGVGPVTIERLP